MTPTLPAIQQLSQDLAQYTNNATEHLGIAYQNGLALSREQTQDAEALVYTLNFPAATQEAIRAFNTTLATKITAKQPFVDLNQAFQTAPTNDISFAVACGIDAGLSADTLATGWLLDAYDRADPCPRFIADRLCFTPVFNHPELPLITSYLAYQYVGEEPICTAIMHCAQTTLTAYNMQEPSQPDPWILNAFQTGLQTAQQHPQLCEAICEQLGAEATKINQQRAHNYFASKRKFDKKQVLQAGYDWISLGLPKNKRQAVPHRFECIQQALSSSLGLGLAAGQRLHNKTTKTRTTRPKSRTRGRPNH